MKADASFDQNDEQLMKKQIAEIRSSPHYLLYMASRLMVASHWNNLKITGVHAAESLVLLELWDHQPLSQKQLGERLRVNHASIGQTLRRLEKQELVVRAPSSTDRRVTLVCTTAKGSALKKQLLDLTFGLSDEINVLFDPPEIQQLTGYLQRLIRHFTGK